MMVRRALPRAGPCCALVVLVGTLASGPMDGEASAASADTLLARVRELDAGPRAWRDRTQRVRLHIVDAAGKERLREFQSYSKRQGNGEDRGMLVFLAPPEIKGTGFLQWSHPDREDEQWLYLSELKRFRQIASGAKKESFVGTDFSYRDLEILNELTRWTERDATTSLGGPETVDGVASSVVTFTPRDPAAMGYERIRAWFRDQDLVMVRVEFEGADGPAKRLVLEDVRTVGAVPTPHRLEMRSAKGGGRTVVEIVEIAYDRDLADDLFTQGALERGGK